MHEVTIRRARKEDVPAIVALLADDILGATREHPGDPGYLAAFEEIDADPRQNLMVATDEAGDVVGTLQLTFIPGMSSRGSVRAQIEGVRVRVSAARRRNGIGRRLVEWAIEEARRHGCAVAQLTSHAGRTDAHRFYTGLRFRAGHVGMKLPLDLAD